MSGIALIIPGADFSGSPLGKVTFVTMEEKVANAVADYATRIGTTAYNDALTVLVYNLMAAGVWDSLEVYPMLGNTIANKLEILNPQSLFINGNILVPASAIVEDGELTIKNTFADFETTIAGTTKVVPITDKTEKVFTKNVYIFADLTRVNSSPHASMAFGQNNISESATIGIGTGSLYPDPATNCPFAFMNVDKDYIKVPVSGYGNRGKLSVFVKQNTKEASFYYNSSLVGKNSNSPISGNYTTDLYNYVGVSLNTSARKADFKYYGFAYGSVEEAKVETVNTILKDFMDSTKPE